ncbi:flavodoxin family protein [Candidatus Dojkabacteria bacterium]|uniref:Flavodoxin family protein n=1 Tax=Candidatus Dojkabacteria bacterium TaxID=2099670 RepID=A0A955I6Z1_9BACT|nr:flavodoxin family protein [Candidatus Dojkabacteria bacterium]
MPIQDPIHIIYASVSGNVELVAEEIAATLTHLGLNSKLHRAEATGIDLIQSHSYFVMLTSTWEHGAINPFFRKLRNEMYGKELSGKYSAFVGLGDKRYEPLLFCKGIDTLQQAFEKAGGKSIGEVMRINGDPHLILKTDVTQWTNKTFQEFKKLWQPHSGESQ